MDRGVILGFVLGVLAGAAGVGIVLNRMAWEWWAERHLMEAGMVRIFERKLGIHPSHSRDAFDAWKAHGYGLSRFAGVAVTAANFPPDES